MPSRRKRASKQSDDAVPFPVSAENPFGIDMSPDAVFEFAAGDAPKDRRLKRTRRKPKLAWYNEEHALWLYQANCLTLMERIHDKYPGGRVDMIFADPPYFLSNGGISCHAGRMVKVDKGDWDASMGPRKNHEFNTDWLERCQ